VVTLHASLWICCRHVHAKPRTGPCSCSKALCSRLLPYGSHSGLAGHEQEAACTYARTHAGLCAHQNTLLAPCRNPSGYVGIRNGGATCYMNSVFQQLFMQPSIRELILGGPEEAPAARSDSVFYQTQASAKLRTTNLGSEQVACAAMAAPRSLLKPPEQPASRVNGPHTVATLSPQSIFGHLAMGQQEAVHPRSFWRAFRDYDGSPINVREHQDAYEFFTRLQVTSSVTPLQTQLNLSYSTRASPACKRRRTLQLAS